MSAPQDPFQPLVDVQPPQSAQPPQAQPPLQPPPLPPMMGMTHFSGATIRSEAVRMMVIGAVLAAVGLVITIATYSAAASSRSGGTYFIAYGPIVFGVIRFFRGLVKYGSAPPT